MHSSYLPDLSIYGTHRQSGGTQESAAQIPLRQISNNMVELPPIRDLVRDHDVLSCSSMSRKASCGSTSSYDLPMYKLSRSSSPMNYHSEWPAPPRPFNGAAMVLDHFQPYPPPRLSTKYKPRCPACLERGETAFFDVNKKCSLCGQKDPDHKSTGKAPRKKRTDRDLYSRLTKDNGTFVKHAKGDGEAGRRYDHSYQHATLQNQMLLMNPNLPDVAARGVNSEQIGWTPLKSNNICEDVSKRGVRPLMFNKLNILESSIQVHRDSNAILQDCQHEREALENKIQALLHSNASPEEMKRFLGRILEQGVAAQIAASRNLLGAHTFQSPLRLKAKF